MPDAPEPVSRLVLHAVRELELAHLFDKDADYGGLVPDAVVELITIFARQRHSGGSADVVISLFTKLAAHEILTPLTGADDEWINIDPEISGRPLAQNKRLSSVFREHDGTAFDVNEQRMGKEMVTFTFPYMPQVKIPEPPTDVTVLEVKEENGQTVIETHVAHISGPVEFS